MYEMSYGKVTETKERVLQVCKLVRFNRSENLASCRQVFSVKTAQTFQSFATFKAFGNLQKTLHGLSTFVVHVL